MSALRLGLTMPRRRFTVKAKALYSYDPANADEIALEEGESVDVVDTSEEEWYKVERNGAVLVAPAAYLELMG